MDHENKPFNDAIEHMQKIEGNTTPATTTNMKKLPKPVRYFGYFVIVFIVLSALVAILLNFLK